MGLEGRPFETLDLAADLPILSGVSGRYASALYDLAREQDAVAAVEADLNRFGAMLDESDDLQRLVRSPAFSADAQTKGLMAVLERAGISGLAANFIGLVARNRRLFVVRDMVRDFAKLAAHDRGEVTAQVTSAEPLSDAQEDALRAALREVAGREVTLTTRVDPALIGGLVVKLGSRQIDTSLKTRLAGMRRAMETQAA